MTSATSDYLSTLQLDGPLPRGRFVIEASAGTGKTYSLTALVARHVAENGLRPDQLLMVTFTRSAATDMRHRTRLQVRALAAALRASIEGTEIQIEPWMTPVITGDGTEDALRLERLETFLAAYDEATISTIHGFLQIVLNRVGLSSPVHGDVSLVEDPSTLIRQVVSDLVIGALAEDPLMFDGLPTSKSKKPLTIGGTLKTLVSATKTVLGNLDSVIQPNVDDVDMAASLSELPGEKRWAALVGRAVRTVRDRLDQSEQLGFDGLVTATRDLLQGPEADVVVASLRQQFRVVMVDEFQDTDHVQWAILSRLFLRGDSDDADTAFGTVGDPKQAIYRFRGADIEAYHEATFGVEQTSVLNINYRSNASLIKAVNSLFEGVRFGSDDIVYRSVTARSGVSEEGVVGSPVLEIRWVPHSEDAGSAQSERKSPTKAEQAAIAAGDFWNVNGRPAIDAIYADTVREIADLIDHGHITDKEGKTIKIVPGNIAILVTAHSQAEELHELLTLAGVPAVRYRTQNVFETRAAQDWEILLDALRQPTQAARVRAVMVSAFGEWSLDDLVGWSDEESLRQVGAWQQLCAEWAEKLPRLGLAGLYHLLRTDRRIEARLAGRVGGERLLTDLDHIAEVLARRPGLGHGAAASDVGRELEALRRDKSRVDEYQRRIESDEDAVHIATVHYSKGLEFPVVFLPRMFTPGRDSDALVFNIGGRRFVDVAYKVHWTDPVDGSVYKNRKALADRADLGDEMRLLYVAATRAAQKLVIYWTSFRGSSESSLGRVLFGRDAAGKILVKADDPAPPAKQVKSNTEVRHRLEQIRGDLERVEIVEVPLSGGVTKRRLPEDPSFADLDVATMSRDSSLQRFAWRKWSYSGLKKKIDGSHEPAENEPEGGYDEPKGATKSTAALDITFDADSADTDSTRSGRGRVFFPDRPSGREFGSLVHTLLERFDPNTADFMTNMEAELRRRPRTISQAVVPQLLEGFERMVQSPLGSLFDGRTLTEIPGTDRRAEVTFEMRLPKAIGLDSIGQVMAAHLPSNDPLLPFAAKLKDEPKLVSMAGSLYGEIDALFRVASATSSDSYVLVDYKTDLVHPDDSSSPLDHYAPDELARAMIKEKYVLQVVLYAVALHRYLGMRLPNYEPQTHFGGVAYLYVRGMTGPEGPKTADGEPYGIMSWKPTVGLLEDLDDLFAGKSIRGTR